MGQQRRASRSVSFHCPLAVVRWVPAAVVLAAIAACGGGSGPETSFVEVSGKVALSAARVSCGHGGAGASRALSDDRGAFRLAPAGGETCDSVQAAGGLDPGLTPEDPSARLPRPASVLRAPVLAAGSGDVAGPGLVVTSISSLVQARVERGEPLGQALQAIGQALELPVSVDLLRTDPQSSVELFRLDTQIGLIVDQVRTAITVAARLTGVEQQRSVGAIVTDVLAQALPGLGRAGLAPNPDDLSAETPLVKFIETAARAVQSDPGLGQVSMRVEPGVLALIAAPGVAEAASLGGAADVPSIVAWTRQIAIRDRVAVDTHARIVVAPKSVITGAYTATPVTKTTSTSTGQGPDNTAIFLPVAGAGAGEELRLFDGSTQFVSLDQFETSSCAAPINLGRHFSTLNFKLGHTPNNEQLSGPRDASFAIDISDEPLTTRRFRAIVDVVRLSLDSNNLVRAQIPDRTNLIVYGKTSSAETSQALQIRLTGDALNIVSSASGEIRFDMNRLLAAIDSAVSGSYSTNPGSASAALQFLVDNRVSSGCYKVKLVLGNTRKAKGKKVGDKPVLQLADAHTVSLESAGGFSLSGHGFQGFVRVTGP
jgi:hypothetical protein